MVCFMDRDKLHIKMVILTREIDLEVKSMERVNIKCNKENTTKEILN